MLQKEQLNQALPLIHLLPSCAQGQIRRHLGAFRLFYIFLILLPIFELLNRPLFLPVHNLALPWDFQLPLVPPLILVYHSWMFLVLTLLLAFFYTDFPRYKQTMLSCIWGQIAAYITFLIFQTDVPVRTEIFGEDFFSRLLRQTYCVDNHYAGFPSVHVTLAAVLCFALWGCKKWPKWLRIVLIAYELLIMLSTLLVDQHVILDLVGGWIYATVVWLVVRQTLQKNAARRKR